MKGWQVAVLILVAAAACFVGAVLGAAIGSDLDVDELRERRAVLRRAPPAP